jgi:lipopolysaccharide export system permease protein
VRLLARYILRQLALPFLFGLLALTGVMLLNLIGRKFGSLVGKGLAWSVIGEVFLLSLPFILAMTLPLAVLVATLYTFSQLTSDNEVTAMRAGGVSTVGLLRPVLAFAAVMSLATFLFVDQVLPRANVRLRNLYFDIGRKKPTFSLTEQVINQVPPSQYHLRASRIDPGSGRLRSVTIYDMALQDRRRIIYADSGLMGYTPDGKDLVLRLWRGSIQQVNGREPAAFQHTAFSMQEIRVGDVFDELERSTDLLERGDREMNTCELLGVVDSARWELRQARARRLGLTRADLRHLVGLEPGPVSPPGADVPSGPASGGYCRVYRALGAVITRETAPDSGAAQPGEAAPPAAAPAPPPAADSVPAVALAGMAQPPAPPTATPPPPPYTISDGGSVLASQEREKVAARRAARYMVEVHKKWALSAACIPFALLAVALALRFPRGGMGLVIGGAMFVYAISYVGLTAGESLADRGFVPPAVAMWAPNTILSVIALGGLALVHRESGSTRGGDLGEIGDWIRRLVRRRPRRPA